LIAFRTCAYFPFLFALRASAGLKGAQYKL
jgi:hypothetical protein